MSIGNRIPFGNPSTRPKVLISLPTTGWVHKISAQAILKIALEESIRNRCHGDIIMPTHTPFENNLHYIVQDVLKKEYDYWISFDPDNAPMNNPIDLCFMGKDIIGCPTPVWHYTGKNKRGIRPIYWNVYLEDPESDGYKEHHVKDGLVPCDAIGTGCFVVSRRVFEHPDMRSGCFMREWDSETGIVYKGNDIKFCERARAAGFVIYAHWDYPCHHFNELDLNEIAKAYYQMYEGDA